MRYFLLPRETARTRRWILCFGCDRSAYPGADAGLGGRRRPLDPEARVVTVARDRRARGAEPRVRRRRALVPVGLPRPSARGRTCCGSPGSATSSASPCSGSSGRQLLVVGVPFGGWAVLAHARRCNRRLWRRGRPSGPQRSSRPCRPRRPGHRLSLFVTAAGIALVGLLLEALFRSARLQSLQAYDAWAFWVPKAKAIYFFGGLDEQIFTTSAGPTYPPIVPILDAAAFHAMGSVDVVTFHLQFWFLVAGGVAAIAGCLYRHVPPVATLAAAPARPRRPALRRAAADAAGRRARRPPLRRRRAAAHTLAPRRSGVAPRGVAALFAGAALTKREGLLSRRARARGRVRRSWPRRRSAWPPPRSRGRARRRGRIPWRLWYRAHDITGEAPPSLGAGASLDRALDSLRLSLDVLFDMSLWSVLAVRPVARARRRRSSGATGGSRGSSLRSSALVFLGGAWVTVLLPGLPITRGRGAQPHRALHGRDRAPRRPSSMPLLLGSAWRRRPEAPP